MKKISELIQKAIFSFTVITVVCIAAYTIRINWHEDNVKELIAGNHDPALILTK